jgi:integrase
VDFKAASLHIRRAKNGTPATHPLSGREVRELRRHQRESPASPFLFVSERSAPLSAPGFSRMIERAAITADLGIKAHAHMLRHACGYKLANDGHDTRAIQRASQHPEYDALYRAGAAAVQGILSRLMKRGRPPEGSTPSRSSTPRMPQTGTAQQH